MKIIVIIFYNAAYLPCEFPTHSAHIKHQIASIQFSLHSDEYEILFGSKLLPMKIIGRKKALLVFGSNSRQIMYICLVKEPEMPNEKPYRNI